MVSKLRYEFGGDEVNKEYVKCCEEHIPISGDIEKIVDAIDNLCKAVDADLIKNAVGIERGIKERCEELKR